MNPIQEFRDACEREMIAGGTPKYCVMGDHDFARMAGAVNALYRNTDPTSREDEFQFNGVIIRRSRNQQRGMMIG